MLIPSMLAALERLDELKDDADQLRILAKRG